MHDLPIVNFSSTKAMESEEEPVSEIERTLGTLTRLLSYPGEHFDQLVEMLYLIVQHELPEAAKGISAFGQYLERCEENELEEAYTGTFDVNPACALEIGWHLFGEDYMRGQFLVRMRQELAKYEIPESGELPDHLTHVLPVVAFMPAEEARQFSHACVFPALHKMQVSLDKNNSPYRHLIRCLTLVLEKHFGASEPWGENDENMLQNTKEFPGQNGPRQPGGDDPLRAFPMPGMACGSNDIELVPLQMQYQIPDQVPDHVPDGGSCQSSGLPEERAK
ncbi:MAG: nitrate reductase molybdenum cofactor assembly chaperone [Planctomycetes bacterium]|nr:nitrate reductase molybdenum cofactor assembly chaperone [Planctomycetota bacterium]